MSQTFCHPGLLCLKTAKEGGHSQWASSGAIHNEMLRQRPELYRELLQPMYVDRKNEVPAGKLPWYQMPVYNFYKVTTPPAGVCPVAADCLSWPGWARLCPPRPCPKMIEVALLKERISSSFQQPHCHSLLEDTCSSHCPLTCND